METINFDENSNSAPSAPISNNGDSGENNSNKKKKKLIMAGAVLVVLILSVIGWQYWQYTQSPYYKQMQAVKTLDDMAKESDKWGGKTPEETVALFTDAVKKGDFELAGRYGGLQLADPMAKNSKTIKTELEKIKTDGGIDQLIKWLETGKIREFLGVGENKEVIDINLIVKENSQEIWILSMHKNDSGTWKIDEF